MTDNGALSAAEVRAMADQAEAEAAEAEALAAAARARARAIQLRRQAELAELAQADKSPKESSTEHEADETQAATEPEAEGTGVVETDANADETVIDGEPDVAPDAESDASMAKPARFRRWQRPTLAASAAVIALLVIIAASVSSVLILVHHHHATTQRRLAAEFNAAARQGVVTLTSLDFNNAKQGVQSILDDSTGSFKDDFAKMADDFTKVVEQSKVIERGTVQAVAVDRDSMTEKSATALVASTSEVTNAAGAKQDPRTFRLIVTLTRDGDQLKMSKVEFVP